MGEADFVIFGPEGLLVVEVKGGAVRCVDGIWQFGESRKEESPAAQANKALQSLVCYLEKKLPFSGLRRRLAFGYAVVFTDCEIEPTVEMPSEILLTANAMPWFEDWLRGAFAYWQTKISHAESLTDSEWAEIHRYLRHDFEIPLQDILKGLDSNAKEFTESQHWFLDMAESNPRVLCRGGAGTGKTFLAEELAIRMRAIISPILFVCRSRPLSRHLAHNLSFPDVIVANIDELLLKTNRAGIEKYRFLIIDEGQDLMNFKDLGQIDSFLEGGFNKGNWCIFHDINNQCGLWSDYESEAFQYLRSLQPAEVPLKRNCRNSRPILENIQETTGCDTGTDGLGDGPHVEWCYFDEDNREEKVLVEILKQLDRENLLHESVLLSGKELRDSCVQRLSVKSLKRIQFLDDYLPSINIREKILYSSIADFKGLESQVVVLIDLGIVCSQTIGSLRNVLYVGMSRARGKLFILTGKPLDSHPLR